MTEQQNNKTKLNECLMNDLVPLSKWNEHFSAPSVGAIRQYIFYEEKYNFKNVFKRIGKRIYISISAFNEWIKEQNQEVA